MIVQETIIDHEVVFMLYHEGSLEEKEERISKPYRYRYGDVYLASIPVYNVGEKNRSSKMSKKDFMVVGDGMRAYFKTEDEAKTAAGDLALARPQKFHVVKILATVECKGLVWELHK